MSYSNGNKGAHGFTIVELLIVVVIIAILAAITIVAYNGIQARAKTSAAQSTASNVDKKVEIYGADDTTTGYPATFAALTATATATYYIPASSVSLQTAAPTSASPTNGIAFYKCGTGATTTAPTTYAGVAVQTGVRVDYWDYTAAVIKSFNSGQVTGLVGTYNIGCGISST